MSTLQEKIAVMQAYADGKNIEMCPVGGTLWREVPHPEWDWSIWEYRVAPVKHVGWINIYKGHSHYGAGTVFPNEQKARDHSAGNAVSTILITWEE